MQRKTIGLGIIGSGRIGTLRARLAAEHPAVHFLATADINIDNARTLAEKVGSSVYSNNNLDIINHPQVNAVIVSTAEGEHTQAVLAAIAAGKPVLVEKPIALNTAEAQAIIQAAEKQNANVRVGYSRRYKERSLLAKEQINQGRLGKITGASARVFNSSSQALAMLQRDPHATPVVDALTYYVDLMGWFLGDARLVEVYSRGTKGVLKAAGHDVHDVCYSVLSYEDGTTVNLGISYALPQKYPSLGHAARVELLGTEGVMILDDDHTDQIMYTNKGIPHVYLPNHEVNMVFLQSGTPGDWALGELWGPLANETRAWLDHLCMDKACVLATPRQARANLEATLAIELSMDSERPVRLPLAG